MQTVLCKANIHAWGSWQKPHWHSGAWFQSRTCDRCNRVQTEAAVNYRSPESEVIALANLADRLGLTKLGTPVDAPGVIRTPLNLGEIDPKLAGTTVRVWVGGPDPATFMRFVQEMTGMVGPDLHDLDPAELADRVNPWLGRAWGLSELELLRIGHALGMPGYLAALTRTCSIMESALQRAAVDDDAPDLSVFRGALTEA